MSGVDFPNSEHPTSLVARIAAAAEISEDAVVAVFAAHGIPLVQPPVRRRVRVHRLRLRGVRAGADPEGSFDRTFHIDTDFTVLVAASFRGKTSVLEIITWCLRGSPSGLRTDVRRWLSEVELDVTIGGQAVGFRLSLDRGRLVSGMVLAAADFAQLAAADGHRVSVLLRASDEDDFAAQVADFMLDRLDLQPLPGEDHQTTARTRGWPAYYSAMYLPSGPDKPLLGDQPMAGLAGRLLQVFLERPTTAVLARVKATRDLLRAEIAQRHAQTTRVVEQRSADRARAQQALAAAEAELDRLRHEAPGRSLTELAAAAARLAGQVADAQEEWSRLNRAYRMARQQRQTDEKILNDTKEKGVARLLFHGLEPNACPRCDAPITEERLRAEREGNHCAVCTTEIVVESAGGRDVEAVVQARLAASRAAEELALADLEAAETALSRLTAELAEAQQQLRTADTVEVVRERMAAELEVARRRGAVEMLGEPIIGAVAPESVALKVVEAADSLLSQESQATAADLFSALNAEIADLGRRFGISALEQVEVNRAAELTVRKKGGSPSVFEQQSAGEQLRLRIAVVIALLRVGARLGISTHPGLVLIDSPKADEVADFDAAVVFTELARLAATEQVQVVITTEDLAATKAVLPAASVVEAEDGAPLW
ncbi:hypothetical protein [Saccharopolyspora sp. 5N708]|uniref:hypothetical protein n=1 Tax=Saccharopolyspora sp. 5N708 TaxID=3457424 RepID=UPI003FCF253A